MRSFLVICLISFAAAKPQYNYPQQYQQAQGSALSGVAAGGPGRGYLPPTPAPIVSKHFYVHSAPEESPEEAAAQQLGAQGHKHYRVVFIKAPSDSSGAAALSLAQNKDEEKTVIYVLTKKTDASDLQADLGAHYRPPSKPEVFFIKYKTQEEAQHAQHQIQAQYDSLGGSTQLSDEGVAPVQNFIGALGNAGHAGAASGHGGVNNGYLPPSF